MKKQLITTFLLLYTFAFHLMAQQPSGSNQPEIRKVPFGDPFIMLWEGTYYAYGTQSDQGIAMYVSDDLLT